MTETPDIRVRPPSWALRPDGRQALEELLAHPLKPRADNVTPPSRTPWGGDALFSVLKAGLPGIPAPSEAPTVGESFEISDDPDLPSRFFVAVGARRREITLGALLSLFGPRVLGAATCRATDGRLPVLIKLIDAAQNLSVQVHPPFRDAALAAHESGKSEAWLVLARRPGAGIFLGLAEHVTPTMLAAKVRAGADLRPLMNFVPVEPGQAFCVPPGTVHAIGAGCTLFEIQRFSPPTGGTTYRLWDWNRTFDAQGRPDPAGQPRPLHLERSLAVIDFDAPRGRSGVAALTASPLEVRRAGESAEWRLIEDLDGLWLHRLRVVPGAPLPLASRTRGGPSFTSLTCVEGNVQLHTGAATTRLRMGESALLPATLDAVEIVADGLSELLAGGLNV